MSNIFRLVSLPVTIISFCFQTSQGSMMVYSYWIAHPSTLWNPQAIAQGFRPIHWGCIAKLPEAVFHYGTSSFPANLF
jgi:hypothetical protein